MNLHIQTIVTNIRASIGSRVEDFIWSIGMQHSGQISYEIQHAGFEHAPFLFSQRNFQVWALFVRDANEALVVSMYS